jgi:chromate transporter
MSNQDLSEERISYLRIFWTFFRIGLLTFGGGFAMGTVMRYELVLKRRWLSEREFVVEMSTATVVPGAIAVNLAFLQGRRLRGLPGSAAAVLGTVLPSVLVILFIAAFAMRYLEHPRVAAFLNGCAIAVCAQIAYAAWAFGRGLRRNWGRVIACVAGLLMLFLGLHPIWAIVTAAVLGYLVQPRELARPDEVKADI